MSDRRVDRIARILEEHDGRLRVGELLKKLQKDEENSDLIGPAIYIAIRAENERLEQRGQPKRFKTSRDGDEEWGYVSLAEPSRFSPDSPAQRIESAILKANSAVDEAIRERLQKMSWRTFENAFLIQVLEKLGFQDVETTRPSKDGGVDARVVYRRGLVEARALVSAKRWQPRATVPLSEVQRVRGITGIEDTAIIITTGKFTSEAQAEVKPGEGKPHQRAVYLIDGEQLVEICKQHNIGIQKVALPEILVLEELDEELVEDEGDEEGAEAEEGDTKPVTRFHVSMLGDEATGLSVTEIVGLLGLTEGTVRSYLSIPERRASLSERIRKDDKMRRRAIARVNRKRAKA